MRIFFSWLLACNPPTDVLETDLPAESPDLLDSNEASPPDTDTPAETDLPEDTDPPEDTDLPIDTDGLADLDNDGVAAASDCDDLDPEAWENGLLEEDVQATDTGLCFGYCTLSIDGFLRIYNTDRTDVDDLSCIRSITGPLYIYANTSLLDMDGLMGVEEIGGDVQIRYNDSLESANLPEVTDLTGYLWVTDNESLDDLSGFDQLQQVQGTLEIRNNANLEELSGLPSLTSIGGDFTLTGNPSLFDVSALYGLTSIGGDLTVCNNTALAEEEVTALYQSIDTIGGSATFGDACR